MTSLPRRAAALAAGAALTFTLASVPTAFVATAAAAEATCGTQASEDFSSLGTLGTTYTTRNQILGDGQAAPGGELTYRVTITGAGALIDQIRHHHDPALVPVSARVSSYKLIGGASWVDHTESMVRDGSTVSVNSAGWTTAGGQSAALEVTYRVPDDAEVGTTYDSGAGFDAVLGGDFPDFDPMSVCGTVRAPNPVESAQGSLEGLGAGSLVEGSVSSSTLASDPSGFIADIINGLDLGELVGGAMGS